MLILNEEAKEKRCSQCELVDNDRKATAELLKVCNKEIDEKEGKIVELLENQQKSQKD